MLALLQQRYPNLNSRSQRTSWMNRLRTRHKVLIGSAAATVTVVMFITSPLANAYAYTFAATWYWVYISIGWAKRGMSGAVWQVFLIAPVAIIAVYGYGNERAVSYLLAKSGDTTITPKVGMPIENALILRYLDKGLLFRLVGTSKIGFLPWPEIQDVTVSDRKVNPDTPICMWFHMFCAAAPQNISTGK